jgi:hypothetical protein
VNFQPFTSAPIENVGPEGDLDPFQDAHPRNIVRSSLGASVALGPQELVKMQKIIDEVTRRYSPKSVE